MKERKIMNTQTGNIALIDSLEEQAIILFKENKINESIEKLESIWHSCFEQPPYLHDIESRAWRICVSLIALYKKQEKYEDALIWALYATQFTNRILDSDFICAGEIYLKMNKFDLAFEMFDKAYKSGKARAFKEHDDAWEFYKNYPTTK